MGVYTLDAELREDDLGFRNLDDYLSAYRRVLDYFDATKVALTATPALHTREIFGAPVFRYGYRQAVIDGYVARVVASFPAPLSGTTAPWLDRAARTRGDKQSDTSPHCDGKTLMSLAGLLVQRNHSPGCAEYVFHSHRWRHANP